MDRVIYAYGRSRAWTTRCSAPSTGSAPGSTICTTKEGSSRVITQFLGHIVRGEPIQLVDGGSQKRAFTDVDDGIDALMKIIENPGGVASGKIFNIGNPANNYSVRELAEMMLTMAADYPEYAESAQPLPHRRDLGGRLLRHGLPGRAAIACRRSTTPWPSWAGSPQVGMEQALRRDLRGLPRPGGRGARADSRAS